MLGKLLLDNVTKVFDKSQNILKSTHYTHTDASPMKIDENPKSVRNKRKIRPHYSPYI